MACLCTNTCFVLSVFGLLFVYNDVFNLVNSKENDLKSISWALFQYKYILINFIVFRLFYDDDLLYVCLTISLTQRAIK